MNMVLGSSFGPPIPVYAFYATGRNTEGQLAQGNSSSPYVNFAQIGSFTTWTEIAAASYASIAIKNDNTLWSWGYNGYYQLGLGDNVNKSSPVQIGSDTTWYKVTAADTHRVAIKTNGTMWSWGQNTFGRLGISYNNSYENYPIQIGALTTWSKVFAGGAHTAAIKTDGTLWMWGYGSSGQIGNNNTADINSPVQVGALSDWANANVSCGTEFTVAVKTNGTMWSWGKNGYGNLGDGTTVNKSSPVQVGSLTVWMSVATARESGYAIKTDGTLWSWGQNYAGALGIGDTTARSSPVQVGALTNWAKVDGGNGGYWAAGIKTDGTLWTWGHNNVGQLGLGSSGNYAKRSSPVQVGSLTNWLSVAGGYGHLLALG
jgi:alpha-tubulin suppressor-like RCC1 family protein